MEVSVSTDVSATSIPDTLARLLSEAVDIMSTVHVEDYSPELPHLLLTRALLYTRIHRHDRAEADLRQCIAMVIHFEIVTLTLITDFKIPLGTTPIHRGRKYP
jgi:hypothetical protein